MSMFVKMEEVEDTDKSGNYVCYKCEEPLQLNSIHSHSCFQVEVVPDNVLGNATPVEYFQEGEGGNYAKVEFLEGGDAQYANIEYIQDDDTKIEFVHADYPSNPQVEFVAGSEETMEQEVPPSYKYKITSNGRRGDWSSADIHRLLDAYITNCRALPLQKGLHNHYLWDRVMKDLKPYGNFSRFLVQAKIKKLKKAGKAILDSGSDNSRWPYLQQVVEMIKVEDDREAKVFDEVNSDQWGPEDDFDSETNNTAPDDDEETDVVGLRRFTIKETRHLIDVYKKHLPKFFEGSEPRKIAWDDIINDLGYGLAEKYTMYQIRAKIRNAQNTYRSIVEKKRKKPRTHWPLFGDLASLAKCEREMAEMHGVPIAIYRWGGKEDPDKAINHMYDGDIGGNGSACNITSRGPTRWNDEETRELLATFKKHMSEFRSSPTDTQENKATWNAIAEEVNCIRRRKINHTAAKAKIDSLRQMWRKIEGGHESKELMPLYDEIKETFDMEQDFHAFSKSEEEDDPEPLAFSPAKKSKTVVKSEFPIYNEDSENTEKKRKFVQEAIPAWFVQFNQEAEKRHEAKMEIQKKLLRSIERMIDRFQ